MRAWLANHQIAPFVAVRVGSAKITRKSLGAARATGRTRAIAAARGCRASGATRATRTIHRICRRDTSLWSTRTVRLTDAVVQGYEKLAGSARAFRPTLLHRLRHLWVEQNAAKASKWAKLARQAHADRRRDLHRIGGDEKVHAAEAVAAGISICATEARHSPATPCHCLTGTRQWWSRHAPQSSASSQTAR